VSFIAVSSVKKTNETSNPIVLKS